jgi:excisionase family DNA binding protein
MSQRDERSLVTQVRLLYSVEEAAELLGIGRTFMFELVATRQVDSIKVGKRRKIPRAALEGYISRLTSEQAGVLGEPANNMQREGRSTD